MFQQLAQIRGGGGFKITLWGISQRKNDLKLLTNNLMLITLLLSYLQFSLFILLNISDIYVKSQGKSEIKPLLTFLCPQCWRTCWRCSVIGSVSGLKELYLENLVKSRDNWFGRHKKLASIHFAEVYVLAVCMKKPVESCASSSSYSRWWWQSSKNRPDWLLAEGDVKRGQQSIPGIRFAKLSPEVHILPKYSVFFHPLCLFSSKIVGISKP